MKKLIFVLTLMMTLAITSCSRGVNLVIEPHVEENLVYEFIMVKPTKEYSGATYDWYLKEETDWVIQHEDWEQRFYVTSNHEATYEVKTVMLFEGKEYESKPVEIKFVDRFGFTFGVSPQGNRPSRHLDYSNDLDSIDKTLTHQSINKIEDQYTYFKNISGTRYIISADIDIVSVNGSDPYPKTGLVAARTSDRIILFAFDARPTFDYNDIIIVDRSGDGGGIWHWPGTIINREVNFRKDGERSTHRLTVIRDVTTFYYLFDDEVIHVETREDFTFDTVAGTYTMAQHAIFSNYYGYMDDPNVDNDFYDLALINARGF